MAIYHIDDVLKVLEGAERIGTSNDFPEGSRYIQISETLTTQMIEAIKRDIDYRSE